MLDKSLILELAPAIPGIIRVNHNTKYCSGDSKSLRIERKAVLTYQDLSNTLFCEFPQVYCLLSEQDQEVTGIAIWHLNYSTWLGKHGIYLEDLYVDPRYRWRGHAKALLSELAKICIERGYSRLQWWLS